MSSCDDIADINEFDESDGESDDDSCDSACEQIWRKKKSRSIQMSISQTKKFNFRELHINTIKALQHN